MVVHPILVGHWRRQLAELRGGERGPPPLGRGRRHWHGHGGHHRGHGRWRGGGGVVRGRLLRLADEGAGPRVEVRVGYDPALCCVPLRRLHVVVVPLPRSLAGGGRDAADVPVGRHSHGRNWKEVLLGRRSVRVRHKGRGGAHRDGRLEWVYVASEGHGLGQRRNGLGEAQAGAPRPSHSEVPSRSRHESSSTVSRCKISSSSITGCEIAAAAAAAAAAASRRGSGRVAPVVVESTSCVVVS